MQACSMDANEHKKKVPFRKLASFLFFQVILSVVLFTYVRNASVYEPGAFSPFDLLGSVPVSRKSNSTLTILLWTWPFYQRFTIRNCSKVLGIPDCFVTADRRWFYSADGVIVHHRDASRNLRQLPPLQRPPWQRWVWFNMESPRHTRNLYLMDNRFNLTMTYRRDSDIFCPYGWLEFLPEPQSFTIPEKSKLVAWVVSNWDPSFLRVKYYHELKHYIEVDVYGKGNLPLPENKLLPTISQYKFYLAFENSVYEDYITEKLWKNAFLSGAVPVVCGPPRKIYERYMPPDSFIHIDDFQSIQDLAGVLLELDKDPVRYGGYFHWRKWLRPVSGFSWPREVCRVCQALQKEPVRYRSAGELSKWFK